MRTRQIARDAVTDSAFAFRAFRRSPGWTVVTLLTIALGVGASTAVFSVADAFLIRPLAYRDASRVYAVSLRGTAQGATMSLPLQAAVAREWRNSARTIEDAAAYGGQPSAVLRGELDDVSVTTAIVDTSFLPFTGARPLIGRNFTADETAQNGPAAIMLAEGFWRRQFGGSPDVLGKALRLDVGGNPTSRLSTIVGVMPASVFLPDFEFERPEVWLPLGDRERIRGAAVRLKPGVSPEAATAELAAILEGVGGVDPVFRPLQPQIRLSRPQDELPFRQALILLTGAVSLLLLIACSNVSHLLLQRGLSRERELAARHALGADRGRLVRQLVTESALLGLSGGALAVLVGWGTLEVLAGLRPTSLPALSYLSTTRGVIPLAAGLAIALALTVGVLGALRVAHGHLGQSLRTGASSVSPAHRRVRGTLVTGQIALSTTLLAGAILLIRVVLDLSRVDIGFDPRHLHSVSFSNRDRDLNKPPSPADLIAFARMIRDAGERQMGSGNLTIAAVATSGIAFESAFESRDHPGTVASSGFTGVNFVAPDYFSVMRMPLVAGRTFDEGSLSRNEVVVSRSLARQLGDAGSVLGREFRFGDKEGGVEPWRTVVGVAPDILDDRLDREPKPTLYRPFPGAAGGTTLIVRLPRKNAGDILRRFARSVQPDPLTWRVRDVDAEVKESMAEPRFTMTVLVVFAASGVLLAAIGLFGVLSYTLALRTREIGVRITLGATRRNIAGLFVRDATGQAALGAAIGLAGAVAVERLTRMSFYGVERFDMMTGILAAVSILLASLAAGVGPLFRAMKVDPAVAIRAE